jgi:hypothetical protein
MPVSINKPSQVHDEMQRTIWALIQDLMGGTQAMRDSGTDWLPKEEGETSSQYNIRLNRSILYNAYRDTVEKLVSKPFSRPLEIDGEIQEPLDRLLVDTDRLGQSLTQFARRQFETGIVYGLGHILVDFPPTSGSESIADATRDDIRPFFVHVNPSDVIGWKFVEVNNRPVLDHVRIREYVEDQRDEYDIRQIEQIRVIFRDHWELHRNSEDSNIGFELVAEGPVSLGRVPLVTWYIKPRGQLLAQPPLEDLAWLNLAHWQSFSDQRNILRYARVPFLHFAGFDEDEVGPYPLGANRFIRSANSESKVQWVEPNGEAIAAGQRDLDSLEARMEVLGLQPLLEKIGRATATGRTIDERHRETAIQSWIRSLESGLMDAFQMAAEWEDVEVPEEFAVHIFSEFGISSRNQTALDALWKARHDADVDHATFISELRRYGVLDETVNTADVVKRATEERAAGNVPGNNKLLPSLEGTP